MYAMQVKGERGHAARFGIAALVVAIGIGFAVTPTLAQQKPAAQKPAPAADAKTPADAAADKDRNFWVKLCEKVPAAPEPAKDGADAKADPKKTAAADPKKGAADPKKDLNICVTHHEQLESNSGMLLVSVAIRQIEGQDKEALMFMVPLGVQLRPGLMVKFDEGEPFNVPFTLCYPMGCAAEIEATKDILEKMKKAQGLGVAAMNIAGKMIVFRVPMQGFEKTLAGPPADNEKYKEERMRVMAAIHQRNAEKAKAAKEEAAKGGDAAKAPDPKKK